MSKYLKEVYTFISSQLLNMFPKHIRQKDELNAQLVWCLLAVVHGLCVNKQRSTFSLCIRKYDDCVCAIVSMRFDLTNKREQTTESVCESRERERESVSTMKHANKTAFYCYCNTSSIECIWLVRCLRTANSMELFRFVCLPLLIRTVNGKEMGT